MNEARLARALTGLLGSTLAEELAHEFVRIRHDSSTGTLERASPGKFVETFVQCLQYLDARQYDAKPDVDGYLSKHAENADPARVDEGLRICGARIARSIYTLRNKRNIAHKNPVDPNRFDLQFCHQGAAWIMAELLRHAGGLSMAEAGALIELVQAPVGTLVEEIDGTRLVHADVPIADEVLLLLHSHFPERATAAQIIDSLKARSSGSVRNVLSAMCIEKTLHRDPAQGYKLTRPGHDAAVACIQRLQARAEAA